MKTAEEWFHTEETHDTSLYNMITCAESDFDDTEIISYIRQIQLDAWKQGMTDAARIALHCGQYASDHPGCVTAEMSITNARDNTTSL